MTERLLANRRLALFPLDLAISAVAFLLSYLLVTETHQSFLNITYHIIEIIIQVALIQGLVFGLLGLYKRIWAYTVLDELLQILKATVFALLALIGISYFKSTSGAQYFSPELLIADTGLLFLGLTTRAILWKYVREFVIDKRHSDSRRVLLIGTGPSAFKLAAEFKDNANSHTSAVGFLDDTNSSMPGKRLQGIPVLAPSEDLASYIDVYKVNEVIITTKLSTNRIREIFKVCEQKNIPCKTLPPFGEILSRPKLSRTIREIRIEDLLGRDIVQLETDDIRSLLTGRTIVVTGAGGSIGSEVARQVFSYSPSILILIDNAETPLYEIDYELQQNKSPATTILAKIADVRNQEKIDEIFLEYKPFVVFHAAAYKHVPMMELNPTEAIQNNVAGTIIVANAADSHGVHKFVMVSTDKAVNPVNIMGATKRIAEIYIQNLARHSNTKFITVRFGNVLGSSGSVIPLFKKQIENGGPLTVTHPDIIRFFMTIQEAAGLILQAGAMGQEGEIFILDMGEPVKIKDLAEDMIRFAGLVPYKDIEIRFVGLRPGEKLYEELLMAEEGLQPTRHKKIHIAKATPLDLNWLKDRLVDLDGASESRNRDQIDLVISTIVPAYHPVYHPL